MIQQLPFPNADASSPVHHLLTNSVYALDVIFPGWVNKIDLSDFSMASTTRCALGQITGNYGEEIGKYRPEIDNDLSDDCFMFWSETDKWREIIKDRRRGVTSTTAPLVADIPTAEARLREAVAHLRESGWDVTVTMTRTQTISI